MTQQDTGKKRKLIRQSASSTAASLRGQSAALGDDLLADSDPAAGSAAAASVASTEQLARAEQPEVPVRQDPAAQVSAVGNAAGSPAPEQRAEHTADAEQRHDAGGLDGVDGGDELDDEDDEDQDEDQRPQLHTVPVRTVVKQPVARQAGDVSDEDPPYPTGVDLPASLHARVIAATGRRRRGRPRLRQTEVLLQAFDAAYPQLADIIAKAKQTTAVVSPLFGTRVVHAAADPQTTIRLQIRPTYSQYDTLKDLAEQVDLSFAELARIVLDWYLPAAERKTRTKAK